MAETVRYEPIVTLLPYVNAGLTKVLRTAASPTAASVPAPGPAPLKVGGWRTPTPVTSRPTPLSQGPLSVSDCVPQTTGRPVYMLDGKRYDSYDAYREAARAANIELGGPAARGGAKEQARRRAQRAKLFARPDGTLRLDDTDALFRWEAAELGVDLQRFFLGVADLPWEKYIQHIFWRIEQDAKGYISVDDAIVLLDHMKEFVSDQGRGAYLDGTKEPEIPMKNFEEHFQLRTRVGEGGQASVYFARELATQRDRVVKLFPRQGSKANLREIKAEYDMLKSVDHPRIQRIYDIFCDKNSVYVILEAYTGGDLNQIFHHPREAGITVTNYYLAKVARQVFEGVAYLHCNFVMHCDLKEANVMVIDHSNWVAPEVVIIDFGLAQHFLENGHPGGTPGYIPPEVWTHGLWTPSGDVHALGVIVFQIFSGEICYQCRPDGEAVTTSSICKAVLASKLQATDDSLAALRHSTINVTPNFAAVESFVELGNMLRGMLAKDFLVRPSVKRCLEHAFFELHKEV